MFFIYMYLFRVEVYSPWLSAMYELFYVCICECWICAWLWHRTHSPKKMKCIERQGKRNEQASLGCLLVLNALAIE